MDAGSLQNLLTFASTVITAIVGGVVAVAIARINAVKKDVAVVSQTVAVLEKNTNSITTALNLKTDQAARAEGMAAGRKEQKAERALIDAGASAALTPARPAGDDAVKLGDVVKIGEAP